MKRTVLKFSMAGALGLAIGCTDPMGEVGDSSRALSSVAFTSDAIVLQWNAIAVQTIGAQPPFPSTRFMAIVQLSVFEAVNAISGTYEPYLGTITAPEGASTEAAAIAAAHGALKALFPAAGATLDAQRDGSLATIPDGQAKTDGVAVGMAAAAAMIANRAGDGSAPPQFFLPTSTAPYEWQVTSPGCPPAGGVFFHWGNVRPFGVQSSSQFRAPAPPALESPQYAAAFNEVKTVGDAGSMSRPADRADVALLYAAQPPHVGWNSIARQIATVHGGDISFTARTLAALNMALADAHFTVFESKYHYRTWRPVSAIPRADEDDNDDTVAGAFTSFVVTPCFPGYPSAHGAGAGAASAVLTSEYGNGGHSLVNAHPATPGLLLNYSHLTDIVADVSDARVFGGIHFRYDQDAGEEQGKKVGHYDNNHYLRPR